MTDDVLCRIDGCIKPRVARGLCYRHWQRWKQTGDPLAPYSFHRWTAEDDALLMACEPCPKELNSAMAYGTEIRQVADKLGVTYHAALQRRAVLVRQERARVAAGRVGIP